MDSSEIWFNPLEHPVCLDAPSHLDAIAWQEHIPFAFLLVDLLRPRVIAELGVHRGDSYLAFCQAVAQLKLDTQCFGIDTWKGDEHAGFYGSDVLQTLREYHDPTYGKFSSLIQATFDESAAQFGPASIDLLHVDGLHTYEAVKHDWETWSPKLSKHAVVLFHDIAVRERDFGVWQLWEELRAAYPHFEFTHGHGLGVLGFGSEIPDAVQPLFALNGPSAAAFRTFFFLMGSRLTLLAKSKKNSEQIAELTGRLEEYDRQCRLRDKRIATLTEKIEEYDRECRIRDQRLKEAAGLAEQVQTMRSELTLIKTDVESATKQIARYESTILSKVIRSLKSP